METILNIRSLEKVFGINETKVAALKSIDFALKNNEFVIIMGPSGSGKSTLLHIIGGMEEPTSGEIYVKGIKIDNLSKEPDATFYRRNNVGFVFQSFNLLSALSSEENVGLPLILSGKSKREVTQSVEEILKLVGLYDRRKHRPSELSGGQQQRIAIARALISRPKILLADEPTGNLDTKTTTDILKLLISMRNKLNQSIILVTHDPMVAAYADRVVFLRDGVVAGELVNDRSKDLAENTQIILEQLRRMSGEDFNYV
ncbi:ABC transporter ATP-binding protein [Paenibacillus sp. MBLB4367]|uniref:ABC transporter ATP-binding protein n=1 Tax=Paenibacillus sp. MBLB4367 TaxID=3384767 RepID=UPI0039080444